MTRKREQGVRRIVVAFDDPVYSISVVSRLTDIPVWTLRVLDRECVVSPKKTEGRTRLYSNRDLERLCRVHYYLKVRKVNVNGLKVLLEGEDEEDRA